MRRADAQHIDSVIIEGLRKTRSVVRARVAAAALNSGYTSYLCPLAVHACAQIVLIQ